MYECLMCMQSDGEVKQRNKKHSRSLKEEKYVMDVEKRSCKL